MSERCYICRQGKKGFFILSPETVESELSNLIAQVGSGVTMASRSSLRCFDAFFSLDSSLCIISRFPVFADRWADECYCATAPSPQKQPEELHRGRGTMADTMGPENTTHGNEALDFPSFLVGSFFCRFVTLSDSWFIPKTHKTRKGQFFNGKEQSASRPFHQMEGRAFLCASPWEQVGEIRSEFWFTFEAFTSSE